MINTHTHQLDYELFYMWYDSNTRDHRELKLAQISMITITLPNISKDRLCEVIL